MLPPWERQRAQHHGYGRAGRVSALARSSCAASRARRSSVEDLLDHRDVLRRNRASLARGVDKPRAPRAAREVATRDNDTVDVLVHADLAGAYISFVPPPWMFICTCWEASPPRPSMVHTTTLHKTGPTSPSDVAQVAIFWIVAGRFVDEAVLGVARRCGARAARARARPIGPTAAPHACSNRRTHTGARCLSGTRFTRKANTVRLVIVLLLGRRCRNVVLSRACRGQDLNGTSSMSS